MDHYSCIIQEDQVADRKSAELGASLRRLGREFLGDDPAEVGVRWTRQPRGWAWTAGEPSTSSIVVRSVPVGLDDVQREAFLQAVCNLRGSRRPGVP